MRLSRIMLIAICYCLLWSACSQPSAGRLSPDQVNARLDAIQQDWHAGRIKQALLSIAVLRDTITRTTDDKSLKTLVALKQADIQNFYCICFGRGFDTARRYIEQLNEGNKDALPDSLKAAIGSVSGFYLYLAALIRQEHTMDSATSLFKTSNALYNSMKDKFGQGLTCFYLGLCYQNNPDTTKNDPHLAESYFRTALQLSIQARDKLTQSYASRHLAGIYFDRHRADSALMYAFDSYWLREDAGWKLLRPFTISLIGDIYQPIHPDSAKRYHLLALHYADTLGYPNAIQSNREALAVDDSLLRSRINSSNR